MIKKYPLVALAFLSALSCLSAALYILHDSDVASAWIQTPGKVTGIVSGRQGNSGAIKYKGSGPAMTVVTRRVAYTYRVDGSDYIGQAFHRDIESINQGMSMSVLYNPENYQQSRLQSSPPWHLVIMWLLFAASFFAAGLWWLRYQRRSAVA